MNVNTDKTYGSHIEEYLELAEDGGDTNETIILCEMDTLIGIQSDDHPVYIRAEQGQIIQIQMEPTYLDNYFHMETPPQDENTVLDYMDPYDDRLIETGFTPPLPLSRSPSPDHHYFDHEYQDHPFLDTPRPLEEPPQINLNDHRQTSTPCDLSTAALLSLYNPNRLTQILPQHTINQARSLHQLPEYSAENFRTGEFRGTMNTLTAQVNNAWSQIHDSVEEWARLTNAITINRGTQTEE